MGLRDREVLMFLFIRFCCAATSAFIFAAYVPSPAYVLYRRSPYWDCWSEYCQAQLYWYEGLDSGIRVVTVVLWMALWMFLELRSRRRFPWPGPRLLSHLRYGPIAVLLIAFAGSYATEIAWIQYSRWQIVHYIHSDAPLTEHPSFRLYNNYRGFCANGMSANEYELYGDVPAAYLDDPDPATRARALQASMYLYDWINNPNDGATIGALRKAAADPDPMVREVAAKYSAELSQIGVP